MKITTSQIFQIGGVTLGAFVAGSTFFADMGIPPQTVKAIVALTGFALMLWNGIGTVLTGAQSQVNSMIANQNDPDIERTLVKTVAGYAGVDSVNTNAQASPALKQMAASNAPDSAKIR